MEAKNMLLTLVFLALVTQLECSQDDVIIVEPNRVRIKYGLGYREYIVDTTAFSDINSKDCSQRNISCVKWGNKTQVKITKINDHCSWHELGESMQASFNVSDLNIYGGPERSDQSWPMGKIQFDGAYVSNEKNAQAVLESYWLDSKGCYIHVDINVPLFVIQNETWLVMSARNEPPYNRSEMNVTLMFRLCQFPDALVAHQDAMTNVFEKPNSVPDFKMIASPVWSTWAKYKKNITQETVEEFASAIADHGFSHGQLEIDDMWERCYGSLDVNRTTFPNMTKLVEKVKSKGFKRVTLWVHPFVNSDCSDVYSAAINHNYLVKNANGSVNTTWWDSKVGSAGYIDFTNKKAVEWWHERLMKLRKTAGIDSFKFDAGESSFTPQVPLFSNTNQSDHPETILRAYVRAASAFGSGIEVRVGRKTQNYGFFVRMIDRNSRWVGEAGLLTLIPELLHMNIIGYSFVLPDMIGGNNYLPDVLTEELFIRWLEAVVFMPVMQFSIPPWDFSEEAVEIAKHYVTLHGSYAAKIHDLMVHVNKTGPVNRPLWWIDPTDPVSLSIDSEYLLGNDILVAPVLEEGARSRDIYLPKGNWKDENTKSPQIITGPVWLKHYPADLNVLPYFSRVYSSASHSLPMSLFLFATFVVLVFIH